MWIKCQSGNLQQTTPSASIEVRQGKGLRYHDVIGKTGKIVMVERQEFDPMQHALVLWRGETPVALAQGDEHTMKHLRERFFVAVTEKSKGFDIGAELSAVHRAQRRKEKRRKRRGGPNV